MGKKTKLKELEKKRDKVNERGGRNNPVESNRPVKSSKATARKGVKRDIKEARHQTKYGKLGTLGKFAGKYNTAEQIGPTKKAASAGKRKAVATGKKATDKRPRRRVVGR